MTVITEFPRLEIPAFATQGLTHGSLRSIPGLQMWIPGGESSRIYQDSAMTTPAYYNDPVGATYDISGNGHHATQATTASKPTLLANQDNGKPTLDFDGVDDVIPVPYDSAFVTVPFMAVVRFKTDQLASTKGSNIEPIRLGSGGQTIWYIYQLLNDDTTRFITIDATSTAHLISVRPTSPILNIDTWYNVFVGMDSSYNLFAFTDGVKSAQTAAGASLRSATGSLQIGGGGAVRLDGQLSDISFYGGPSASWIDTPQLDENVNKINAYLNR